MRIYNSLSGQKEEFQPAGDVVKIYVCGITPYDDSHIGHAMSYVIFDVVRRYLEYRNYKVKYIQNFTDIDDKIINRANRLGISARELSDRFIERYFHDMDALNIRRADTYPRVTGEIPEIINVVQGLIDRGHAYQSGGSVYFRVKSDPDYGKLSHRNPEDISGDTSEENKESALDFALWKASKEGEPAWESPWGTGRPGWHIECTAMALKYLGNTIDIHGGGEDLVFPHHENEIAQSECYTGEKPFAVCWMHNGMVQMGKEKMSKSLGNIVPVKDLLKIHSADAIRLFIISSYYRSPLTYSEEGLDAAEKGMERLRQAALKNTGDTTNQNRINTTDYQQRFIIAMDDDFGTPQAVAALFDLAREINKGREEHQDVTQAQQTLVELAHILGLTLAEKENVLLEAKPFIELLITLRADLRIAKQWQLADKIRSSLVELGVILEDSPQGTTWKSKK